MTEFCFLPLYYIDIQKKVTHPGRVGLTDPYMKRGQQKIFTMKFSKNTSSRSAVVLCLLVLLRVRFGRETKCLAHVFSSSGNSLGSIMLSGWNRIWDRHSAFQFATSLSCSQKKASKIAR